mgnify:FL=1
MTGSIRFIFIIFEEHSFQLLVKERKYQQYQAQNDKHNDCLLYTSDAADE